MTHIRGAASAAFATCLFASVTTNAQAALRAPNLWESRTIQFVICSEAEPDPQRLKRCGDVPRLSPALTARFRQAVVAWNQTFQGHIQLQEVMVKTADAIWVFGQKSDAQQSCSANDVGYARGAQRYIKLGSDCGPHGGTPLGTILHEIGHIVGLQHEQRRPDRDDYLIVNMPKLRAWALSPQNENGRSDERRGWAYQYTRLCHLYGPGRCTIDFAPGGVVGQFATEYGLPEGPYDFDSIMHYDFKLRERDPLMIDVTTVGAARLREQGLTRAAVGQRDRLSSGDIAAIKALYP